MTTKLRLAYVMVLVITAPWVHAQPLRFGQPTKVKYKNLFYDEPTGTVAFLPRLGNARYISRVNEFHILPTSGVYELPAKGNYYFQIQNVTSESRVTFLQCAVYTFFRKGDADKDTIRLYRSPGQWDGRQYSDGSSRKIFAGELTGPLSGATLDKFWQVHKSGDLKAVDEMMGTRKWHAWPTKDLDSEGSWDFRRDLEEGPPSRFDELMKECGISDRGAADICLTAQLIRFTTPTTPDSSRPLYFTFNGDNALGAYMHLRSPLLPNYSQHYYIKFASNWGSISR